MMASEKTCHDMTTHGDNEVMETDLRFNAVILLGNTD
jgi:hypothetical protein